MFSDVLNPDSLSLTGDPCPQPQKITASMLYPCCNATSVSYFDSGSKAGFGIFVIALFFFPVGQYNYRCPYVCSNKDKRLSFFFFFTFINDLKNLFFLYLSNKKKVSFLVAYIVAYIRATKYKRFLKRTQSPTKDKTTTHGIRGSLCSLHFCRRSCVFGEVLQRQSFLCSLFVQLVSGKGIPILLSMSAWRLMKRNVSRFMVKTDPQCAPITLALRTSLRCFCLMITSTVPYF